MRSLTINSHSLATANKDEVAWQIWFSALKFVLRLMQIKPEDLTWTFDDFYRDEEKSLALLERFGFEDVCILYCPDLLGRNDAGDALRNPDNQCAIGTEEDLIALSQRFRGLRVGVHSMEHRNFEQGNVAELDADMRACKVFHAELFGRRPDLFAFPYGRARADFVDEARRHFDTVYLSDNRIPYSEQNNSGLVNRIHLELGGNLPKFFLKILLSRYRRQKARFGE